MASKALLHVVAGVIYNAAGQVLIARRAAHQHQGGLWEFPGGKLELGETPSQALRRELEEELGICPTVFEPLIRIIHQYPDKSVLLDTWQVTGFEGAPWAREAQPWCWVATSALSEYAFPAANLPIIKALKMPRSLAITGHASSASQWMNRLEQALVMGAQSIQVRSASLPSAAVLSYLPGAAERCLAAKVPLILNSRLGPIEQLLALPCDGIHFRQVDWQAIRCRPLPPPKIFSLACHTAADLQAAEQLEADFVLLSPVLATRSHPEATPLGWRVFEQLCATTKLPVMALGGLTLNDMPQAKRLGAQGIAAISAFWLD